MPVELLTRNWGTLHGLVVLLGLAVYATASHTLRQRRHPSAAIAWVISLLLLPYVALPLYLLFGTRKVVSSRRVAHLQPAIDQPVTPATTSAQLATAIGLPDAAPFHRFRMHEDGSQALDALREMIAGATRTLDVSSFLLGRDTLGNEVSLLLMQRARAGVRVRLLIDGIGYTMGRRPGLRKLRAAGVEVALFVSPLRSALRGRTNLRNHRKLVIADGDWMWCGGRNLAAEYFVGDPTSARPRKPWDDLSFDLHGPLAAQGQERFALDWDFATTGRIAGPALHAASTPDAGAMRGRIVASGPDQTEDTIFTLLVSGCFTARSRVLAVTPYFVPEPTLLMALALAARRGIRVDLLLPRQSNHRLADIARHLALRELSAAGARIWLAPDMVHAKAVLIDDDLALVGSANLDERSLFLNYELMVAFDTPAIVQDFAAWIERRTGSASLYHAKAPGIAREVVEGLVRWVAFQL